MYSKNFNKFCKQRNISESSKKGYLSTIKKYEKYNKLPIDQLISEAIEEEKQATPLKERKIKKRLLNCRTYLLNSKLSQNTVRSYFVNIKTFYQHFEIEIPYPPEAKYAREYETNYLDLPSKDHIQKALDISTLHLRVWFLTL